MKYRKRNRPRTIIVTMTYATGMIEVNARNIITSTPPVWRSWIGSLYQRFYGYYERKGKLIKTDVRPRIQKKLKIK